MLAQPQENLVRLPFAQAPGEILPAPASRFHERRTFAVRAIEGISQSRGVDRDVVARSVSHAPPEVGRDWRQVRLGRKRIGLLDQPFLVPREPRMAVHPVELERHPVRPKIAFLEHVGADPAQRGNAARRHVIRPAVSEQQDVGDLMFAQEIVEEHRPVAESATEIGRCVGPVGAVTGADIDPFDLHPALAHRDRELVHHWPRRTLEEQEGAPLRLVNRGARPVRRPGRGWRGRLQQKAEISHRSVHWTRLLRRRIELALQPPHADEQPGIGAHRRR